VIRDYLHGALNGSEPTLSPETPPCPRPDAKGGGHRVVGGQPGPQSTHHEWKRGAKVPILGHFKVVSSLKGFRGIERHRQLDDHLRCCGGDHHIREEGRTRELQVDPNLGRPYG
jgi:hypothetical protein